MNKEEIIRVFILPMLVGLLAILTLASFIWLCTHYTMWKVIILSVVLAASLIVGLWVLGIIILGIVATDYLTKYEEKRKK